MAEGFAGQGLGGPGGREFPARLWALAVAGVVGLWLLFCLPAGAQFFEKTEPGQSPIRRLSARELNYLLKVAEEPLLALKESRPPRPLTDSASSGALNQTLPAVVTLWLDGQILARAWEIRQPQPLVAGVEALAAKVLDSPDQGRVPTIEEWPRVKVGLAVLHQLAEAADEKEVAKGQAVVVLEGFTIGLGLPKDMTCQYESADLLSKACQMAGLRPNAWLLPDKLTIFSAAVDEIVGQ